MYTWRLLTTSHVIGLMGHPKAGGRVKGTPNKKTQSLLDMCESKKISPFEALLELCLHDDVQTRLTALKEVCQYLYPKRKAIEMDIELVAKKLDALSEEELVHLAEEKLKQIKGSK